MWFCFENYSRIIRFLPGFVTAASLQRVSTSIIIIFGMVYKGYWSDVFDLCMANEDQPLLWVYHMPIKNYGRRPWKETEIGVFHGQSLC